MRLWYNSLLKMGEGKDISAVSGLKRVFGRAARFLDDGVWRIDADALGGFRRCGVRALRFVSAASDGFLRHPCGLHAAGLTYFSMLALVPVLCLLMVCARTCGVDDFARAQINAQIDAVVAGIEQAPPEGGGEAAAKQMLAAQVRTFSNDVFDRIAAFEVGTLGWIGCAMLAWTVISSLGQVETAMNEIWRVPRARSPAKKAVLYLFIALVLPLLAAAAMSLPALRAVKAVLDATLGATSYTKWAGDALGAVLDSRAFSLVFSFVFSVLAFAFLLKVMPNCRVRLRAALAGGALTAALFGAWLKFCTSAGVGIARSSALYGSFAALPIVLAWIYMSWQIVLLGSCLTYAFECVHRGVRLRPGG